MWCKIEGFPLLLPLFLKQDSLVEKEDEF